MKFSIDKHDKYVLIQIDEDRLDTLFAPALKSEFVVLNAAGFRNMIVDLSKVKYVDSSGLSSILIGNRLCSNVGGSFVVSCLQPNVQKLIEISQLQTILNIVPTNQEATDFVFIEEIERDLSRNEDV